MQKKKPKNHEYRKYLRTVLLTWWLLFGLMWRVYQLSQSVSKSTNIDNNIMVVDINLGSRRNAPDANPPIVRPVLLVNSFQCHFYLVAHETTVNLPGA